MNDDNNNPTIVSLDDVEKDLEEKKDPTLSPERQDEQSISGSMPDPESDDDTLKNAQNVDEQYGESTEAPQEIDINRDVNEAEESIKTQ
ncbi:MAG TPA: hypothetical protein VG917_05350 [Patescibacteria group bacterium]|nr:hypothetical protein [Patescibacteria group bacterium]